MINLKDLKIGVIGLGYVGLPLACELSKHFSVYGYDLNKERMAQLNEGIDNTKEVNLENYKNIKNVFTDDLEKIKECNFFIITVPTPVDSAYQPDLEPIKKATINIAKILKKNDIVVYESTVYPGVTEEFCAPILEKNSNLKLNKDFFIGYSPERIVPGDKKRTITKIQKITSGSNKESAEIIDSVYKKVIEAGTFKAKSIKVAEAAKVIENVQRDINIALINELSIIFGKMNIDTYDVLQAAKTKWNFLDFQPGLVGGHCIGVDPYYLTYAASRSGHNSTFIELARSINNNMPKYIIEKIDKYFMDNKLEFLNKNALILGFTFKENCPDTRNTKVIDLYKILEEKGMNVDCYDPQCNPQDVSLNFNIDLIPQLKRNDYKLIIIAVPHKEFLSMGIDNIKSLCSDDCLIFDVKNAFNEDENTLTL